MSREEEIAKIDAELEKMGLSEEGFPVSEDDEPEDEEVDVEDLRDDLDKASEEETEEEVPENKELKTEEAPKEDKKELKLEINTDLPAATLGYKLREEARRREALEKEVEELKKPKIDREENPEAFLHSELEATKRELNEIKEWRERQERQQRDDSERNQAFNELRTYEAEAETAFDDFKDASNYVKSMIAASIKTLNGDISPEDLAKETANQYARKAGSFLLKNKHPGQGIYEYASQIGYKKPETERPKIEMKQDNRPSLEKIAANKKKSSGMNGNGSSGKAFMTTEAMMSLSNAEKMKLSESDWARMEAESGW